MGANKFDVSVKLFDSHPRAAPLTSLEKDAAKLLLEASACDDPLEEYVFQPMNPLDALTLVRQLSDANLLRAMDLEHWKILHQIAGPIANYFDPVTWHLDRTLFDSWPTPTPRPCLVLFGELIVETAGDQLADWFLLVHAESWRRKLRKMATQCRP